MSALNLINLFRKNVTRPKLQEVFFSFKLKILWSHNEPYHNFFLNVCSRLIFASTFEQRYTVFDLYFFCWLFTHTQKRVLMNSDFCSPLQRKEALVLRFCNLSWICIYKAFILKKITLVNALFRLSHCLIVKYESDRLLQFTFKVWVHNYLCITWYNKQN